MGASVYREYQAVFQLNSQDLKQKKPRKSYKRSILGCLNCKKKKIKCDETKTRCKNCQRSQLECIWPGEKHVGLIDRANTSASFIQEPNFQLFPQTPRDSNVITPQNSRSVEFLVSQELSSSRELPAEISSSSAPMSDLEDTTPSTDYPEENLEHVPLSSQELERVLPAASSLHDSKFFETLGIAFASASDYLDFSSFSDREQAVSDTYVKHIADEWGLDLRSPLESSLEMTSLPNEIHLKSSRSETDTYFLSVFIHSFLPTLAQVNFQDKSQCSELVIAAAKESPLLQEVFIACGASMIAFNNASYRHMAQERYTKAINTYLDELKLGNIQGGEVWFFVAVQVLQILCLRDMFADGNATRCAAHFGAAYKIISLRLSSDSSSISSQKPLSELEKIMLENFLFNYSITVFFCDHRQLPDLVPSPFEFFHASREKLVQIFYDSKDRYKYRSMLAFQIAAKCAWSCRLKLPLDEESRFLHMEITQLAEALLLSFENEADEYCHPHIKATMSIAKVVLNSSLILLSKFIDFDSKKASDLQHYVKAIRVDIDKPHNRNTILPIWSLMIAASTSTDRDDRSFFKECLEDLLIRSKSKIIVQILNHLDGLWELYEGEEPFEMMFDTTILDQVSN